VTSRRMTCDAAVVRVTGGAELASPGVVPPEVARPDAAPSDVALAVGDPPRLDLGRRTRTVSPALRRALELRDRGCRFPGCSCRFTDAHHIVHWADGGRTDLRNLVLLCRRHHRAVHEGGMRVCLDREGRVVFFDRRGRAVFDALRRGMPRGGLPRGGGPVREASPGSESSGSESPGVDRVMTPPALPSPRMGGRGVAVASSPWPGPIVRWRHDRDIPWAIEARAREALDSG
ncbi:MAG: HNH endonuclease signature motif containing protein, partial [Longimicrobiales bacterium]|nr:HNH endonuclease signature motif containing protein [Longimicrobiales bacterium]